MQDIRHRRQPLALLLRLPLIYLHLLLLRTRASRCAFPVLALAPGSPTVWSIAVVLARDLADPTCCVPRDQLIPCRTGVL